MEDLSRRSRPADGIVCEAHFPHQERVINIASVEHHRRSHELFHLFVMNINGNCAEPLDPNLGSLCIYPFLDPASKEIDPELLLHFQTALTSKACFGI